MKQKSNGLALSKDEMRAEMLKAIKKSLADIVRADDAGWGPDFIPEWAKIITTNEKR